MAFDLTKTAYGQSAVSNLDKIKQIPLEHIATNAQNFYSMDKIAELADSIRMVGLMHPISVVPDGDRYRLVSGHRRLAAYRLLNEEDLPGKWRKIPAIVVRSLDYLEETLALITANSTARELTYREKLEQEKILRETLLAMKAAGTEIPKNLGQYIADQIGVSRNEVSRMHSVNENLIPEARAKVDAGEMTAQQAYELSRKPEAEQKSEFVDNALSSWQAEAQERRQNLALFVRDLARGLSRSALSDATTERYESIQKLQKEWSGRGGGSFEMDYFATGKGVRVSSRGYTNERLYTYTEVWDALAIHAIRKLTENPAPTTKESPTGWQTGTPEQDGEYACLFRSTPGSVETRRILYWYNECWNLFNTDDGCPISEMAEVHGWILLPAAEEDAE